MANPEHLEILRRGIGDWYRWRRENSDIKPDLTGANLRKANLEHFYFRGANLREADLQGANLQEADFREANLQGINLQNTNLQEADFREANLQEANFREANLQEADFREANLQGADLQGTNLQDASFSGASLQNVNLQNANITNANLVKANLSQSNFSKAILSRANFYRAVLTSSSFVKADCRNTIFSKANLESSNLQQAEMVATIALKTNLEGVKITGACIQDWNINSETNLKNVECDYIYLKSRWEKENRKVFFEERRPHNPDEIFASGDFERLLRKAQETVDLIFRNGIDWQAFLNSYEQLKVDAGGDFLPIQAIENKGDGSFVVRIQAPPELDKGKIQKSFETKYKQALKLKEQQYRKELNFKDREIELYREQNTNLWEMVKLKASQPINIHQQQGDSIMSGDKDIQIVRGNNNWTAKGDNSTFVQGDNNQMSQGEQVSATEVIEMLAYLEEQIQNLTALPEAEREKSIKRLEAAKVEATESEPDKESIAKSLKRVNETLNEAGETTQEVKELVKELFPTVVKVAGWLGYAAGKIWMM